MRNPGVAGAGAAALPHASAGDSGPFATNNATCFHRIRVLMANGSARCARCRQVIEPDDDDEGPAAARV